jgi:hypothetical protein
MGSDVQANLRDLTAKHAHISVRAAQFDHESASLSG